MADEVHDPRRPNQVASLVHSPLWRSVHLAAPPLIVPSLDAQQLHSHRRTRGTPLDSSPIIVQTVAEQRAGVMNNLHSPAARLSRDDQAWLRSRLEALVGRFQASVPRHAAANPVRDDAVRVALGRVTASLRSDVEVSRNRDDSWTIVGFLTWILMECKLQLRGDRPFDEDFLIDARAWYRYCHNKPWESLYYDDVSRHLKDMEADLERIQRCREALQHQHSLAKPEFLPVARRNGRAF
ncbi:hypothetical protein NBRC10512_005256 [Rhodotorula toruloides]|uniref:Uncharacterized protein n=1 Tax=Rhodotorula toruloides (strain NP11) TaxID=1130832 RepID=M7WDM8_RHOT1|nr:uncharacterized protein RHTO_05914 [Rhodotorula toruloides NP11]EMS18517.1 hypothetical protein RHTO_05914 [Rhodotorula toruloides NP11]